MLKIIDKIIVSDQAPKGKNVLWLQPSEKGYQIKVSSGGGYTTINTGSTEEHEYVDLGLPSGTLWATCNVGADKPESYGSYFAWGETHTKGEYTEENSLTLDKEIPDISGNPQYDAARCLWGGNWRIPTKEECEELVNNCTIQYTIKNQIVQLQAIGPNGNSIIIPCKEWYDPRGFIEAYMSTYWSSSPGTTLSNAWVWSSHYVQEENYGHLIVGPFPDMRYYDCLIRPVKSKY